MTARKPRGLKVLAGTIQPCRDKPEPEYPTVQGDIGPPDWLDGVDALNEWNNIVGILQPARVLSVGDLTMLGHLCNAHGRVVKLWRRGMSPTAADLTQLRLMLTEFGLTPASRVKAGTLGQPASANPFEALKSG